MKIGFVVPYFGQFPNYFSLFLKSCKNNPDYEWLLFTDRTISEIIPQNVHIINVSFDELKRMFQQKFDFKIALDAPYKLCDYKPAYGFLFSDYLGEYDYWGYCDLDIIIGNLKKFLPENEIMQYDKIGHLGHMTLYKNEPDINKLFMNNINEKLTYKEIFSTNQIHIFDEWGALNINQIFERCGKKIWYWNQFCDIYPYDDFFKSVHSHVIRDKKTYCKTRIEKKPILIFWEEKAIYKLEKKANELLKKECAYAHFQKRNMELMINVEESLILCSPNIFEKYDELLAKKKLSTFHIINKSRFLNEYAKKKYWMIEKTAPIRHLLRKRVIE